jgi:glycosyltransferase involved in cell wall biosynthesis
MSAPVASISVVICTYNRAPMLHDTLASWQQVRMPAGVDKVELLLIDNACSDDSQQVIEAWLPSSPCPARYIHEPRSGLSHARNRGIDEASGNIIAFVDDDIYFDPDWLCAMLRAFARYPDAHCIGGQSIPTFETQRPAWITDGMMQYYGSTMSGDADRPMRYPEHPFGVNMAFRSETFERIGGFRTDLGRIRTSLLSSEEKELFYRMHIAGLEVMYAAEARLLHRVPAERVERRWLLRRAYWQGVSKVVFEKHIAARPRSELCHTVARSLKRLLIGAGSLKARTLLRRQPHASDFGEQLRQRQLLGIVRQSMVEILGRPRQGR